MDNKRQDLVSKILEGVAEAYQDSRIKIYPLGAIWMEKVIRTSRETKRRLTVNDLILVENGEIIDCNGEPSHKILRCEGTLANNELYFVLENLATKETERLKL